MLPVAFSEPRAARRRGGRGRRARRPRAAARARARGAARRRRVGGRARAALEHATARWEKLGDVVCSRRRACARPARPRWRRCCARRAPRRASIAAAAGARGGAFRAPPSRARTASGRAAAVAEEGADGWVAHRENGIVYGLDVTRNMFSSGNGTEKAQRPRNCDGEVVVDLYADRLLTPFYRHAQGGNRARCDAPTRSRRCATTCTPTASRRGARCTPATTRGAPAPGGDGGPRQPRADPVARGRLADGGGRAPTRGGRLHVHANVGDGDEARWTRRCSMPSAPPPAARRLDVEHVERVKWYAPRIRHVVADVRVVAAPGTGAVAAADVKRERVQVLPATAAASACRQTLSPICSAMRSRRRSRKISFRSE